MGVDKVPRKFFVESGTIRIGADVNIFRAEANVLKTADSLVVSGGSLALDATNARLRLAASGTIEISTDTAIRRMGAGTLRTNSVWEATAGILSIDGGQALPVIPGDGGIGVYATANVSYFAYRVDGTTYRFTGTAQ